jgi:hypothetical protein
MARIADVIGWLVWRPAKTLATSRSFQIQMNWKIVI